MRSIDSRNARQYHICSVILCIFKIDSINDLYHESTWVTAYEYQLHYSIYTERNTDFSGWNCLRIILSYWFLS